MKAGKETEMYNQGYMDGFDDAVKSEIEKVTPKLKDVKEKSFPKDEPDYWEQLKHQYAGMAMQGILTNPIGFENLRARGTDIQIETALLASEFAHALVEKMKEESK